MFDMINLDRQYSNYSVRTMLNIELNSIYDNGYSVIDILDNYFLFIKITDIISEIEKYKIIKLLCKYITIFYNIHEDAIELTLFTNNLIKIFS